jgi:hypothetical protein
MDTWRKVMPDYALRRWDANSFDFDSVPFVRDAIRLKKWAFAADYIRLFALYHEGGIYLDTDVEVYRCFDPFLVYGFFSSQEVHPYNRTESEDAKLDRSGNPIDPDTYISWIHILSAVMGAEPHHPYLEKCLSFYANQRLVDDQGESRCREFIIGPRISKIAESFGYRYHPAEQRLAHDMIILPPEVFVGDSYYLKPDSYALHLCNGSWHERNGQKRIIHKLRNSFPALSPALNLWEKVCRNIAKPFV